MVAIQPDPRHADLFRPFARLTERVSLTRHPDLAVDGRRLIAELRRSDALSPLAVDGLVLVMMATAARLGAGGAHHARPPRWLLRVRDLLHARFAEPLRLAELAAEAGVHPSHLAHEFRRHFATSFGAYVRRLRVSWAAERLERTDQPLCEIALGAGYCDQSHLTREFHRAFGLPPAAYRARAARRRGGDRAG